MESCGESPHPAWFLVLAYLPLHELISMSQVCKSFRDAISNDVLIWLNLVVESPLSLSLTDEILMKMASKAHGRLQNLALLNCVKVTDAGLLSVVNENPLISKLYVPSCTGLTPEGVLTAVTVLTSKSNCLTALKIGGIYNLNQNDLHTLESYLPKSHKQKLKLYHRYNPPSFRILDEDTGSIDVEICSKCKEVKLVFDCPRNSCGSRCIGCIHCVPRCECCGECISEADDEQGETICKDYLCLTCWLRLPKCNLCNKPFCPRHANVECDLTNGTFGFVCEVCQEESFESFD